MSLEGAGGYQRVDCLTNRSICVGSVCGQTAHSPSASAWQEGGEEGPVRGSSLEAAFSENRARCVGVGGVGGGVERTPDPTARNSDGAVDQTRQDLLLLPSEEEEEEEEEEEGVEGARRP